MAPLFRRPDGTYLRGLSPERRFMPYMMPGRNESCVYHEQTYDISKTRRWLRDFNRAGPPQTATMFHLVMWVAAQCLHLYPRMNRFVSNRRLYQRKGTFVSFAAKKEFSPTAPLVTVKKEFQANEPFAGAVANMTSLITEGRSDKDRQVDKELKLALLLPALLLRLLLGLLKLLDRWNLLPGFMIKSDPMYASLFVANLGSVGLDNTFHHLYEYGTVSVFAALGTQKKTVFIGRGGTPEVRDGLQVRWTLDERIGDGFYAGEGLRTLQQIIEDPERYIGAPDEVAAGKNPNFGALFAARREAADGGGEQGGREAAREEAA